MGHAKPSQAEQDVARAAFSESDKALCDACKHDEPQTEHEAEAKLQVRIEELVRSIDEINTAGLPDAERITKVRGIEAQIFALRGGKSMHHDGRGGGTLI